MPEQRGGRRLAAILAADVAGYSRLVGLDEEGTLARLRTLRAGAIDPEITSHRGRIVKTTGDGLLVEFASVVDAVRCAVALQRGTAEGQAVLPEDRRIAFRIGVNLGDIVVDGDDILGDGVNIAARLEGIADPGGICISASAHDQVRGKIEAQFADLGEQSLKNIALPIRAYRVLLEKPASAPAVVLPLPDKPSIAVLPFQNLSGDPEQEFFADGMVEDITTALSKLRWFFVIARNSAFTYKGRAVDVKQVGRELGVRYILEGSVRRGGKRLRVTAQLVDAMTGNHVWAERYDRGLADLFAVQDEITECVVAAIEPELYAAENIRSQRKPPDNLDAWECVIRALSCIGQGTRQGDFEAEALCRRAIASSSNYGQAHSLLAWSLLRKTLWSGDLRTVLPEVSAEVELALAYDDRDPWAYLAQCMALVRQRRFDDSARAAHRALDLNPNFALAYAFLGHPLIWQGEHERAISCAQDALRLSPHDRLVSTYAARVMMFAYFGLRQYPECISWARDLVEKSSGQLPGYFFPIAAFALVGDADAAAQARETLFRLRPDLSLAWIKMNLPLAGEIAERMYAGLRLAGVPEQ